VLIGFRHGGRGCREPARRTWGACAARLRAWSTEPGTNRRLVRGGPVARLDAAALTVSRALVAGANALSLAVYAEHLAERIGVRVSRATVCRALQRLGLVRKKTLRAAEQDRPEPARERAAWRAELAQVDPGRLVFLDEGAGSTPGSSARMHGRLAAPGPPARCIGALGGGSP
jgi:transposase